MPHKDIIFGEYLPDRQGDPSLAEVGAMVLVENARPTPGGYVTAQQPEEVASAATLGATPVSAAGFSTITTPRHYAGSATNLYESSDIGQTWYTNSKGAGYTTTSFWDFALFGTAVVAVNGLEPPQTKSVDAAIADDFADLAGSPPTARLVARVRDHLVLGGLSSNFYALQTSAIGDPTDWPVIGSADALAKQAILQELPRELGMLTDLVGGEKFGLVFQVGGITRMTYIGGNVVYEFDTFERSRGTGLKGSAVQVGSMVYYINVSGVYRTDGYAVQNLSQGRIEESVIKDLAAHAHGSDAIGGAAYDSRFDTVMWQLFAGNVYYLLQYHVAYDRFTLLRSPSSYAIGALYSVRNSAAEGAQQSVPYMFSGTPRLMSFTDATTIVSTFQTGFIELAPGYVTQIEGVQFLGARSTSNVLSVRSSLVLDGLNPALLTGFTVATAGRSEILRVRSSGRYHALKWAATVTSGQAISRGIRVHYKPVSRL